MVVRIKWYIIRMYDTILYTYGVIAVGFRSWIYLVSFKSLLEFHELHSCLNCALNRGRETMFRLHSETGRVTFWNGLVCMTLFEKALIFLWFFARISMGGEVKWLFFSLQPCPVMILHFPPFQTLIHNLSSLPTLVTHLFLSFPHVYLVVS